MDPLRHRGCARNNPASVFFRCALAVLFTSCAFDAAAQDALKVELISKALEGEGLPAVVVIAEVPLDALLLRLKRSTDGRRITLKAGPLGGGRRHTFSLPMKRAGRATFAGTLDVEVGNGQSGQMPISVDVELLKPLKITIERTHVDVAGRRLKLSADRAVKRVQITAMSDLGTPLGTTEASWGGNVQPAGAPFEVRWKQAKGTLMRITVQAWDEHDFFGAVDLFPWQVDIPHEEVNFATGSFEIAPDQGDKLVSSRAQIQAAIDKYGALAKIRLFIGGHTDTVGDGASNRALSNNRARAIGRWFRAKGLSIPILFAGFGEDRLLVDTPDSTDEPRNRRAEYIVAVDPPALIGGVRWTPIR